MVDKTFKGMKFHQVYNSRPTSDRIIDNSTMSVGRQLPQTDKAPEIECVYWTFNGGKVPVTGDQLKHQILEQASQDEGQSQLKSYNACNSFIKYYNNFDGLQDYFQMRDTNSNTKQATKAQIIQSLLDLVLKHQSLILVRIHYNGHASVTQSHPELAGKWCCGRDQFICVEEILLTINEKAKKQDKKMRVNIDADCNGAAGIYYRVINFLNEGKLQLHPNLHEVIIHAPCDYNEKSFSSEHGGVFTHHKYETQQVNSKDFQSKVTLAGPNKTQIKLQLMKSGEVNGVVYRGKIDWKKCEYCKHSNFKNAMDCTACEKSFDSERQGYCASCTFLDNPKDAGKCTFCGAKLYTLTKMDQKL